MSVQGTQIFLIAKKNALCYAKPVEEKTNAKGLMEAAPVHWSNSFVIYLHMVCYRISFLYFFFHLVHCSKQKIGISLSLLIQSPLSHIESTDL